jgi:hypothetical protein
MSMLRGFCLALFLITSATVNFGCSKTSQPSIPKKEDQANGKIREQHEHGRLEMNSEVEAALAELSKEDQALARAQKFCAVEQENLLGSMGAPFKLVVDGQPVFLCCEGCKDTALKHPQATLAAVSKLKQSNTSTK